MVPVTALGCPLGYACSAIMFGMRKLAAVIQIRQDYFSQAKGTLSVA